MMKTYCTPKMVLFDLSAEDILTASSITEGDASNLASIKFNDLKF